MPVAPSKIVSKFREIYGEKGTVTLYMAPGRVNLIGEHTDYNGGYVFPMALDIGTYIAVRKRADKKVNLCSFNFDTKKTIHLDKIEHHKDDSWIAYPKGVIAELLEAKFKLSGMDIFIYGDLPNGAGLSSSASLEVACAYAFAIMGGKKKIDYAKLATIAQKAENNFVGVKCGIMDQFASAMGKQNHAILLNTTSMEYEHVPLKMPAHSVVIVNSNKKRGLVDSEYNTRRKECESAFEKLKAKKEKITSLSGLTEKDLTLVSKTLRGKELKRAKYVIEENARVHASVTALKKSNNLKAFGEQMVKSHEGLRDLYEVSCKELDILVDASLKQQGVLGARMTGAGFGGCIVAIVAKDMIEQYIEDVYAYYKDATRLDADFYIVKPSDGVREISYVKK